MVRSQWPKVSIAVLNYNGISWLKGCLDSLAHTDYPNLEVMVADNGSTDSSEELVRRAYLWALLA